MFLDKRKTSNNSLQLFREGKERHLVAEIVSTRDQAKHCKKYAFHK